MPGRAKPPAPNLADALSALTDRQPERALSLLLDTWRQTRDGRLAASIEVLSERLLAGRPPPFDDRAKNPRQEWLALARKRTDVVIPWLLGTLMHLREDVTEERITEMASWPADPRIARVAARALPELWGKNARRNAPRLLQLLTAMGDPRFIADLAPVARMQRALGGSIGPQVRATVAALEEVPVVALPAGSLTELEHAVAAVRGALSDAAATDLEALHAAVYADPGSDGPRLVLADALMERNFPRGEFISLQVARAANGTPAGARERKLLKRWEGEWLEAWAPHYAGDAQFARGFLRAASFVARPEPVSAAWRTVEAIELWNAPEDARVDLLADPVFSSLREVRRVPLTWIDAGVAQGPRAWTVVHAEGRLTTLKSLTRRAGRLPSLETLLVEVSEARELIPAAVLLFSAAWDRVHTRTVSSGHTFSLSTGRLTFGLAGAGPEHLVQVATLLKALPPRAVSSVLLEASGTLRPEGLFTHKVWFDLKPLAALAKTRGLKFLWRQISETRIEPVPRAPVEIGEALLVKPPSSLDEHVARLERLVGECDFASALDALRALIDADPKRKTRARVAPLLEQAAAQQSNLQDPRQVMCLRTIPLVLQGWS